MKKNKKESQTGVYLKDDRDPFKKDADGNMVLTGFETLKEVCGYCHHRKGGFCKRNAPAPVLTTKFDEALYIARWARVDAGEVACGEFKAVNV